MKILFIAIAALAITDFHSLGQLDTFDHAAVSISGSIIQETGTNGQTTIKPISIANFLTVLGTSGTAKDLQYYYDDTTESYVIAAKAAATSGSGTPVATIITYTYTKEVNWYPNETSMISSGPLTGMDSNLSGLYYGKGVYAGGKTTYTLPFTLYGEINTTQTIVRGAIVYVAKGKDL